MPDKRQESKQRRAARNRASREALAARRENAVEPAPTSRSSSASSKAGTARGAAKGGTASTATGSGPQPPPRGIMGTLQSKRPGDKAVLAAFALAVVAAIYLLFYQVPADDRGEPLPSVFRGLAIAARERLTGQDIGDQKVSLLDASGPQIFLVLALPVAVTAFALWANRRADRSRMLTFAMLAMAGSVILTGGIGIFFFPALIALAVGGFRVRKADLPARTAERATGGGLFGFGRAGRGTVIDADSEEVTDEGVTNEGVTDEEVADEDVADESVAGEAAPARSRRRRRGRAAAEGEEPGDGPVDADGTPVDAAASSDDEVDPLAELEAELEAERAAEADAPDGDDTDGNGSRRKR